MFSPLPQGLDAPLNMCQLHVLMLGNLCANMNFLGQCSSQLLSSQDVTFFILCFHDLFMYFKMFVAFI